MIHLAVVLEHSKRKNTGTFMRLLFILFLSVLSLLVQAKEPFVTGEPISAEKLSSIYNRPVVYVETFTIDTQKKEKQDNSNADCVGKRGSFFCTLLLSKNYVNIQAISLGARLSSSDCDLFTEISGFGYKNETASDDKKKQVSVDIVFTPGRTDGCAKSHEDKVTRQLKTTRKWHQFKKILNLIIIADPM